MPGKGRAGPQQIKLGNWGSASILARSAPLPSLLAPSSSVRGVLKSLRPQQRALAFRILKTDCLASTLWATRLVMGLVFFLQMPILGGCAAVEEGGCF